MNKCKERFSPIWDFVKGNWKSILTVLILTGIVILTILLNYHGYLDTYQFLTDLFSGLIIVITGWILAWIIVHRYQRNKERKGDINLIIDQLSETSKAFDETYKTWTELKAVKEEKRYFEKSERVESIENKLHSFDIIFNRALMKLKNTFPEWTNKTVPMYYGEELIELNVDSLELKIAKYRETVVESVTKSRYNKGITYVIIVNYRIISLSFKTIIIELIS